MNETPSSAIAAATGSVATPAPGRVATVAADSSMVPGDAALDHAAALALDDAPVDVVLRARPLVEIIPRPGAAFCALDEPVDWIGAGHDRMMTAPGLDLVFDGVGGAGHLAADQPAFAAARQTAIPMEYLPDPLVMLGSIEGEPVSFAPAAQDAPVHVVDDVAHVGLQAPDLHAPELSWLAALNDGGLHVGEAWSWNDATGAYAFDHYVQSA
jgi:hypothetical protein